MSEEKIQVLKLLEKGQITYQEALALLQALEGASEQTNDLAESDASFESDGEESQNGADGMADEAYVGDDDVVSRGSATGELGQELQTLGEQISEEVRDALQGVSSEVNSALHEVGEELREIGRDNNIADFLSSLFGGGSGQRHCWQQEKQIEVDDAINSLSLAIFSKNGSIRLSPTDDNQLTVRTQICLQAPSEAEAREMAERCLEEQQEVVAGQLQLAWRVNEEAVGAISFEVSIPRKLVVELDLSSKNGSVSVTEVQASGKVATKNGSVRIDGPNYDGLEIETKNGDITVAAGLERLVATSKNGSVRCSLEPLRDGHIALTATNGSVRAELACQESIGYKLELETRSGRLSANLPDLVIDLDKKQYLRGSMSNWETAKIKTHLTAISKNGSVSVRAR